MTKNNIKYRRRDNTAKSFGIISNKLIRLAPQYGLTPSEMINAFITDLENSHRVGYRKIIDKVEITGLSQEATFRLVEYLSKIYAAERKKEARDKQVEKHQIETEKNRNQYIDDVWEKVCEGADSFIKANEDKLLDTSDLYPKVWINVFERIDGILKKITSEEKIPDYLKSSIMKKVEDEIYYQEVKYFTEDFKFLAGIPDAGRLSPYGRKFIRYNGPSYKKMYNKYIDLRESIPVLHEESVIREMIKQEDIDNVTKRILVSRLERIERTKYETEHGNVGFITGTYRKASGEER